VGSIARVLGELRDLDVLKDVLITVYCPELPNSEQKKLEKILAVLEQHREKATQATKKVLEKNTYQTFKKDLNNWLERPIYTAIASLPIAYILPELLSPQISTFLLHPGWIVGSDLNRKENMINFNSPAKLLEELSHAEEIVLHSLRKEAKKTRYLMELATTFYGENYRQMLNRIQDVQTILGEIQDGFVLRQLLTSIYGHDLPLSLPMMTQKIKENRLQHGLQWEELRQFFLATENRTQLRLSNHSPHFETIADRTD